MSVSKTKLKRYSVKKKYSYSRTVSQWNNKISENQEAKQERENSDVDLLFITIVLILLAILLLGLVLLVGYIVCNDIGLELDVQVEEFAVPCEELSLSPYEDAEIFDVKKSGLRTYVDNDGRYICSSENKTNIVIMVVERQSRLRLSKGLTEEHYLACGNESLVQPSGHLTATFTEVSNQHNLSADEYDTKLRWNQDGNNSFVDTSMELEDGEITIPESRTYLVFASAHFNLSLNQEEKAKQFSRPFKLSVCICRRVNDYEQTLFGRTQIFNTTKDDTATTLSISGPLVMTRDDKIYVKVTGIERLIHNSKGTTFGLFPL